jgi:hypothetical protein
MLGENSTTRRNFTPKISRSIAGGWDEECRRLGDRDGNHGSSAALAPFLSPEVLMLKSLMLPVLLGLTVALFIRARQAR